MATYDSEPQPVEPTPGGGTADHVERYMREMRALHAGVVPPAEQPTEKITIAEDMWSQPSEDDRPGFLQERLNWLGDNTIGAILLWFYNNL